MSLSFRKAWAPGRDYLKALTENFPGLEGEKVSTHLVQKLFPKVTGDFGDLGGRGPP